MSFTWRVYTSEQAFLCFFFFFCYSVLQKTTCSLGEKINTFLICGISFSWGDIRLFSFLDELMRFRASPKRDSSLWDFCSSFFAYFFWILFFFLIFSLHPHTFPICESSLHTVQSFSMYSISDSGSLLLLIRPHSVSISVLSQPQAFPCHSIRGKMLPTNLSDYIELCFRIQTWAWTLLAAFCLCWRAETNEATVHNPG